MTDTTAPVFEGHGAKSYRAYALLALTIIYTFNFVDRSLVGVTQEPLKQDLNISDFQLGLLGGPVFAILYTLLGVPIARLAERRNRISIIAIGAAAWSVMTAACGFAANYMQLVLARIGVGIGEAACTPPSQSVISDYFPSARRATALSIYALGIPVGTMVSALGGGWLVGHYGWRAAFWALGLPGLIAALLLKLTVREPPRSGAATDAPSFSATLAELARKRSFWHMAIAAALMSFVGYATAQFLVSYLVRTYELGPTRDAEVAVAGGALGIVAGVSVAIGTFFGGFLTDRLQKRFPSASCWLPGVGIAVALPIYLLSFSAPTFNDAFRFLLVAPIFHYLYLGPMYAVSQSVVPPRMRATTAALLILIVNLIGYTFGPPTLGAISDYFAGRELATLDLTLSACSAAHAPTACAAPLAHGIRYAMITVVCVMVWPMIHFFLASRSYQKDRVS